MKNSRIEWCNHTFNPWIGCTKVSPGCANCYAEAQDDRWGNDSWGFSKPRRRTSEAYWKQPLKWDREEKVKIVGHEEFVANCRPRVFCASLADWLDDEVPIEWLADLLDLIRRTPHLDWLLLTKRPQNWNARLVAVMLHEDNKCRAAGLIHRSDLAVFVGTWIEGIAPHRGLARIPHNVWIGTSVEDQTRADERIPHLLEIPARVRFLSCEPLLGPLDVSFGNPKYRTAESYHAEIHWVICGGESGHKARPMHPNWAKSLRDQCKAAGVPFLFKQWGNWLPYGQTSYALGDPKAGDGEWCSFTNEKDRVNPYLTWLARKSDKHLAGRLLDGVEHNSFPSP